MASEYGVVDFIVGASPGPVVFIIGTREDSRQQHYLNLYKMGEGPYYCFTGLFICATLMFPIL